MSDDLDSLRQRVEAAIRALPPIGDPDFDSYAAATLRLAYRAQFGDAK